MGHEWWWRGREQKGDSHFDLPRGSLIVGFQVQPFSVKHTYNGAWNTTCAPHCPLTTCGENGLSLAPRAVPCARAPPPRALTRGWAGQFNEHGPQRIDTSKGGEVIWTYDVVWEESDVMWASRWDVYLSMTNDNIHWFSIINSIVILVCPRAIPASGAGRHEAARLSKSPRRG